jgi:hypothetical protein
LILDQYVRLKNRQCPFFHRRARLPDSVKPERRSATLMGLAPFDCFFGDHDYLQ